MCFVRMTRLAVSQTHGELRRKGVRRTNGRRRVAVNPREKSQVNTQSHRVASHRIEHDSQTFSRFSHAESATRVFTLSRARKSRARNKHAFVTLAYNPNTYINIQTVRRPFSRTHTISDLYLRQTNKKKRSIVH